MKFKLLTTLLFLSFFSCKKTTYKQTCEEVACDQYFNTVTLRVVNEQNSPITLDKYFTVRAKTGEVLNAMSNPTAGNYTILTDSYTHNITGRTEKFIFTGLIDNEVVVNEVYHISADCCHITKQSGNTEISVK